MTQHEPIREAAPCGCRVEIVDHVLHAHPCDTPGHANVIERAARDASAELGIPCEVQP